MSKVCEAGAAVALIGDGATVAIGGTGPVLEPDFVLAALEQRFLDQGHPKNLSAFTPILPGDRLDEGGLNCIAHEGMLRRIVGASFSVRRHPRLIEMIRAGKCEGYVLTMGAAFQLLTAIGSKKPGVFTSVGIGTFADPRVDGGGMNEKSTSPPVRVETIDGETYLFYPAFPVDVAIIRATTADENGYLSMEEEPNTLGMVELALAAKACGGKVIAQVKRVARAGSLDPRLVRVPGPLVDAVVVSPRQTQVSTSMADPLAGWNPFFAGALKAPYDGVPTLPQGAVRVMMRRAALELRPGDIINLGQGVATQLPSVALEEGILDRVVFTNEHGIFGGLMASALGGSFVPALNAEAIMDSIFQFNYYDGGGLDIAFLGMGQVDAEGNLNVSKFGREWYGPGGFINITDCTPRIVFCGTLTSGGLKSEVKDGKLNIREEGRFNKFVEQVEQITFNGPLSVKKGQHVLYVTERAVFHLTSEGPELIEIAPGVDLDRDIRSRVGFPLKVSDGLKEMVSEIFGEAPLGLDKHFDEMEF